MWRWWGGSSHGLAYLKGMKSSAAVRVGGHYVVAGNSSPSGSTAYPSLLEDGHLEYSVSLTTGLLPNREEIHILGPTREPLEVQVTAPSTQVLGM